MLLESRAASGTTSIASPKLETFVFAGVLARFDFPRAAPAASRSTARR